MHGLLPCHPQPPLPFVDHGSPRVTEEVREAGVVFPDERRREAEGVEQPVLDELRQAEVEQRADLEQHPLGDQLGGLVPERGVRRVLAQERPAEEPERRVVVPLPEIGLPGPRELALHEGEELAVDLTESRDHVFPAVGEEVEEQGLERGVVGLGGVDVGEHAVAAREVDGRHEGAREEVGLVDEGGVEEDGERGGVQERHHARVLGHEGAWRHVEADHGGAVRAHAGREEPVAPPRAVEVLETVLERAHQRRAVVAGHLAEREAALRGHHLVPVRRGRGRARVPMPLAAARRRRGQGEPEGRRGHFCCFFLICVCTVSSAQA